MTTTPPKTTTTNPWPAEFGDAIADGEHVSRLEIEEDWGADWDGYSERPRRPRFPVGLRDHHFEYGERIALAQAHYLKAIAVAAAAGTRENVKVGENVHLIAEETAGVKNHLETVAGVLAHQLPHLVAETARNADAQAQLVLRMDELILLHRETAEAAAADRVQAGPYDELPGWLRWLARVFGPRSGAGRLS